MRVTLSNAMSRFCIVTLELRARRRVLTRQVRPVGAGRSLVVVLRPRVKPPRGVRVRLVTSAR